MKSIIFVLLMSSITFFACKSDTKSASTTSEKKEISQAYILNNQSKISEAEVTAQRNEATPILESRIQKAEKNKGNFLHDGIWIAGGLATESRTVFGDSLNGAWLDFQPDFTYTYGQYSDKIGSGRYHFNAEESIILMLDDNASIKPQEFKVLNGDNMIVLQGEFAYRDSNMQAKFDRNKEYPVKK